MSRQQTLAETVRTSARPVFLALTDVGDADRVRQAPGLPNHVAWVLGHCALTMHRAAERLDDATLPDRDFVVGDGSSGDSDRFDTESVCLPCRRSCCDRRLS